MYSPACFGEVCMSAYVKYACGSDSLITACLETTLDYEGAKRGKRYRLEMKE